MAAARSAAATGRSGWLPDDADVAGLRALLALRDVELHLLVLLEVPVPSPAIALKCTKTSGPPSSWVMKPKPFSPLNHFTVPVAMFCSSFLARTSLTAARGRSVRRPRGNCTWNYGREVMLNPRGHDTGCSRPAPPACAFGPLRGLKRSTERGLRDLTVADRNGSTLETPVARHEVLRALRERREHRHMPGA